MMGIKQPGYFVKEFSLLVYSVRVLHISVWFKSKIWV